MPSAQSHRTDNGQHRTDDHDGGLFFFLYDEEFSNTGQQKEKKGGLGTVTTE